jgi:integrase
MFGRPDLHSAKAGARTEASLLKVNDIDSQRMVIHIHQGKGSRDRDVPLRPKLLEVLREYWRWRKPKDYLFPSTSGHRGVEQPISDHTVWNICKEAAVRAGIQKKIGPAHSAPQFCHTPHGGRNRPTNHSTAARTRASGTYVGLFAPLADRCPCRNA